MTIQLFPMPIELGCIFAEQITRAIFVHPSLDRFRTEHRFT